MVTVCMTLIVARVFLVSMTGLKLES